MICIKIVFMDILIVMIFGGRFIVLKDVIFVRVR